jgi:hypothetical protein
MQRVLNDLVDGLTSAGWRKWCDFVFADADAQNAQAQLSEFEALKQKLELEKQKKHAKLMIDCLNMICSTLFKQAWAKWLSVLAYSLRAGRKMLSCLNGICNSQYQQAWTKWLTVLEAEVAAGRLMLRVLNALVDGLTSAGWRKWVDFVYAEADAEGARRQDSDLERMQRKLEKENDKFREKLQREKNAMETKQQRAIEDLEDRLEMQESMKAGKKMRDCLNMICNTMFKQAWEKWLSSIGKTKNAGKLMQRVLNSIVDGLTTAAWSKWCDFMVVSVANEAKDDELQLLLGDMQSQLRREVMIRAASTMTHCLNLITERMSRDALRFWHESCLNAKRAFGVAIVRKLSQFIKILQTRITVLLWSYWTAWKKILDQKILDQLMLEIEEQEMALASRDMRTRPKRNELNTRQRRRAPSYDDSGLGAGREAMALYKELLEMAMSDGVMDASESNRLAQARGRHGVTAAQHDSMLAEVAMSRTRRYPEPEQLSPPTRRIVDSLADVGLFRPPLQPPASQAPRRKSTSQQQRRSAAASSGSSSTRRRGSRDTGTRDAERKSSTSTRPRKAASSVRWRSGN